MQSVYDLTTRDIGYKLSYYYYIIVREEDVTNFNNIIQALDPNVTLERMNEEYDLKALEHINRSKKFTNAIKAIYPHKKKSYKKLWDLKSKLLAHEEFIRSLIDFGFIFPSKLEEIKIIFNNELPTYKNGGRAKELFEGLIGKYLPREDHDAHNLYFKLKYALSSRFLPIILYEIPHLLSGFSMEEKINILDEYNRGRKFTVIKFKNLFQKLSDKDKQEAINYCQDLDFKNNKIRDSIRSIKKSVVEISRNSGIDSINSEKEELITPIINAITKLKIENIYTIIQKFFYTGQYIFDRFEEGIKSIESSKICAWAEEFQKIQKFILHSNQSTYQLEILSKYAELYNKLTPSEKFSQFLINHTSCDAYNEENQGKIFTELNANLEKINELSSKFPDDKKKLKIINDLVLMKIKIDNLHSLEKALFDQSKEIFPFDQEPQTLKEFQSKLSKEQIEYESGDIERLFLDISAAKKTIYMQWIKMQRHNLNILQDTDIIFSIMKFDLDGAIQLSTSSPKHVQSVLKLDDDEVKEFLGKSTNKHAVDYKYYVNLFHFLDQVSKIVNTEIENSFNPLDKSGVQNFKDSDHEEKFLENKNFIMKGFIKVCLKTSSSNFDAADLDIKNAQDAFVFFSSNQGCRALYELFNLCNNNSTNVLSDVENNNLKHFVKNELSSNDVTNNDIGDIKNDIFDLYGGFCIKYHPSNPNDNANVATLFKQKIHFYNESIDDWFDKNMVNIDVRDDVNEKLPLNHYLDFDQRMRLGEDFKVEIKIFGIW